jgi:beta-mannosidase
VPTSPLGPSVHANAENVGKGVHWNVHGPWKPWGNLDEGWTDFWAKDDALFRPETGSTGACSAEIIRQYAGDLDVMPASVQNPLWTRHSTWWIEWDECLRELGREPESLEEYVEWSQARQAKALSIAVGACKRKFPRCAGILMWMGHDCYPCTGNTSIIDFNADPKPAALALSKIWRTRTLMDTD